MYRRRRHPLKTKGHSTKKSKSFHIKPGADAKLKKIFAEIGVPDRQPFTPDTFQLQALSAIQHSDCLVTAPTGAGKTWIAEEAIARTRKKGGKAWYASPLKALTNSKYLEFAERFGHEEVGILTITIWDIKFGQSQTLGQAAASL